jgi:hypothetical protein
MPIDIVKVSELAPLFRRSKISSTPEWTEIKNALEKGLPRDSAIRITFTKATIEIFNNDLQKTAVAFLMKLRKDYGDKYQIRLVNKVELQILNLGSKSPEGGK